MIATFARVSAFGTYKPHVTSISSRERPSQSRLGALSDLAGEGPVDFHPSRRVALLRSASVLVGTLSTGSISFHPVAVQAKPPTPSYPQEIADKDKIVRGYKRLDSLLRNWEKETTICGRTDNPYIGCERTPEKVMEYLGYKSMNDPLFRADKTLFRLQALVESKDDVAQGEFQEALDLFVENSEEGNGLAFVSSWGEANPGGGKDRIEIYIERSKKDVIACHKSLATAIRILDLNMD